MDTGGVCGHRRCMCGRRGCVQGMAGVIAGQRGREMQYSEDSNGDNTKQKQWYKASLKRVFTEIKRGDKSRTHKICNWRENLSLAQKYA